MRGAIPHFPTTPAWRGAQTKQRGNFDLLQCSHIAAKARQIHHVLIDEKRLKNTDDVLVTEMMGDLWYLRMRVKRNTTSVRGAFHYALLSILLLLPLSQVGIFTAALYSRILNYFLQQFPCRRCNRGWNSLENISIIGAKFPHVMNLPNAFINRYLKAGATY
jgi:hypothetical protein